MKQQLTFLIFLVSLLGWSQEDHTNEKAPLIFTPELMAGFTAESNEEWPETKPQYQGILHLGWDQRYNTKEWAQRLKISKTGLGLGYTSFGNKDTLGNAYTLMPFIEFRAFRKERLKVFVGMGGSYFTELFDPITNANNRAVSTKLSWSFKLFLHYQWWQTQHIDWRVGAGYSHHSNGHTRLPNNGFNSFLVSVSADVKQSQRTRPEHTTRIFDKSSYSYLDIRSGIGQQVLSLVYNDKKNVYTISGEYGKVFNNTFKLGGGFYYRYYQQYHDYIKDNQSLVQDGREFDFFKENPTWNATGIGLFVKGEVLLNHIGIEVQLGANLHKPAYKIDWRINEGWDNTPQDIPTSWVLGEFGTKYKFKQTVSSRLGLKYYLFGTSAAPKNNIYLGFHINANLGQADFTELSLGYVYNFNFK